MLTVCSGDCYVGSGLGGDSITHQCVSMLQRSGNCLFLQVSAITFSLFFVILPCWWSVNGVLVSIVETWVM